MLVLVLVAVLTMLGMSVMRKKVKKDFVLYS
jgi:hypothetical protein